MLSNSKNSFKKKKTQEEILKDRIALWNMPLTDLLAKRALDNGVK